MLHVSSLGRYVVISCFSPAPALFTINNLAIILILKVEYYTTKMCIICIMVMTRQPALNFLTNSALMCTHMHVLQACTGICQHHLAIYFRVKNFDWNIPIFRSSAVLFLMLI